MEIIDDVERAAWLGPRMYRVGGWARVGSVAGYGFEAYARILHPRPTGDGPWEHRRWSDVATAAGKVMHPLVQWERLLDLDEPRGGTSDVGYLDLQVLAALAPLLMCQTATPDDALAAYWVGGTGQSLVGRSVTIDRYDYALAQTDTAELAEPGWGPRIGFRIDEPPQLLWPEDHAWVLTTEIDWDSTIVAGSQLLIDSILPDDRFEAYQVVEDSDLSWNGDTINRRTNSSPVRPSAIGHSTRTCCPGRLVEKYDESRAELSLQVSSQPSRPPVVARRLTHLVGVPPLGPVVELLRQSCRKPVLLWRVGSSRLIIEQNVLAKRPLLTLEEDEGHLSLHETQCAGRRSSIGQCTSVPRGTK